MRVLSPEEALQLQRERYRSMTGEQRLKMALDLQSLCCAVARDGIRRQFPDANEAEVEKILRRRIEAVRR